MIFKTNTGRDLKIEKGEIQYLNWEDLINKIEKNKLKNEYLGIISLLLNYKKGGKSNKNK